MRHPELLLVPVFMLADHFLTLIGAAKQGKKYNEHFKTEHYELNPVWQDHVKERKWINPKHLFLTGLLTVLLTLLTEYGGMPDFFIEGVLGCVLTSFGTVIGRHLSNLMIFELILRKPELISGQVTLSHHLSLSMSLFQLAVVCVPLAVAAAFSRSPFVIGGLVGVIFLIVSHLRWIRKHRKQGHPHLASENRPSP